MVWQVTYSDGRMTLEETFTQEKPARMFKGLMARKGYRTRIIFLGLEKAPVALCGGVN